MVIIYAIKVTNIVNITVNVGHDGSLTQTWRPERRRTFRAFTLGRPRPCVARRRLHQWPGYPSTPNPRPNPAGRVHDLAEGQAEAMRGSP